jgi:hypothetical protein
MQVCNCRIGIHSKGGEMVSRYVKGGRGIGRYSNIFTMWVVVCMVLYAICCPALAHIYPADRKKSAKVFKGPEQDAVYLNIRAGEPRFETIRVETEFWRVGDEYVHMEGFNMWSSPGDPMLPYQIYEIALPPDVDPASLSIEVTRRIEEKMKGFYDVVSGLPSDICQDSSLAKERFMEKERWGEGKDIINGKNVDVYGNDALFPPENCRISSSGQMRKWKIASVVFFPIRYNPVKRELHITREVDLIIRFNRKTIEDMPEMEVLLRDDVFDTHAQDLLFNYGRAHQWYLSPLFQQGSGGGRTCSGIDDPDFAVITTENTFLNSGTLDDFCIHKAEKGFQVLVVTEHQRRQVLYDTGSGYYFHSVPGGYGDVTNVPAPHLRCDSIRTWLQGNYGILGIKYVLLVGNPDPENRLVPGDLVGDLPMCEFMLRLYDDVPTDYYYAELTGDWDLDGDGKQGEWHSAGGESDGIPAGVTPLQFSVRFEGVIEIAGAPGALSIGCQETSEGSLFVWIDVDNDGFTAADLVIDDNAVHYLDDMYKQVNNLGNGYYPIRIEYTQRGGDAYCDVWVYTWTDGVTVEFKHDDGTGTYHDYLVGSFYNNTTFSGTPAAVSAQPVDLFLLIGDKGVGGVEFYPEVIVGRIPFYDEDQDGIMDYDTLDMILDKIISYENTPFALSPWKSGILTSAPYVADKDADGNYTKAVYEWAEFLRRDIAPPSFWQWYRIYEEAYPEVIPPAEIDDGCTMQKTLEGWNVPNDPDDGRGVVLWMTHGSQDTAMFVFDNYSCKDLDDTKPSIVFMGACKNGLPEFTPPDGIPLGFANLKHGAIGTVSATRNSFG